MQIAGIAVRRQIEKKCTASRLNFSPETTELVYGPMIGSTMVEKRLLMGSEVEDYLSVSLVRFLRTEVNLPEKGGSRNLV
jgi:hypothetical protein